MKVNTLKLKNQGFPASLRQIPEAPAQIYWVGAPISGWLDKPRVAVVGSRKATAYGTEVTRKLCRELARKGVVIISGLALGIDSVAHRTTLEENGLTIAVLPTSLDKIYPSSHAGLARQIVDNGGTLISEYPVGQQALKFQFTARNRIVSGLADVVLITEAAVDSGTMTTARYALDQGKTVLVVPGNITSPSSEGCNNLIKSGALPVTEVSDILFALQLDPGKQTKRAFHGSDAEANVFRLIEQGITDQDELAEVTKLSGAELASLLSMLEINGYIRPAGNGRWLAS